MRGVSRQCYKTVHVGNTCTRCAVSASLGRTPAHGCGANHSGPRNQDPHKEVGYRWPYLQSRSQPHPHRFSISLTCSARASTGRAIEKTLTMKNDHSLVSSLCTKRWLAPKARVRGPWSPSLFGEKLAPCRNNLSKYASPDLVSNEVGLYLRWQKRCGYNKRTNTRTHTHPDTHLDTPRHNQTHQHTTGCVCVHVCFGAWRCGCVYVVCACVHTRD